MFFPLKAENYHKKASFNFCNFAKTNKPMSRFHALKVKDIRTETPHAISIAFEVPAGLKADYEFIAGQYLNIKHQHNGEEIRRAYSICVSPNSGELRIVVKVIENGIFSNYATRYLKVGDVLEVGVPEGKFTFEGDAKNENNYAGFAAGSGITPVMSIAQTVLESEPKSTFVLVYGNKTPQDTIFYDQLHHMQQKYLGRFFVHYTFTKVQPEGALFGRIERSTINYVLKNKHNEKQFKAFYVCGPEDMIVKVSDVLKENNIPEEAVHFELFTPAASNKVEVKVEGMATITVLVDGVETTFEMSKKTDILDAALKQGIDAPYSCQGGICSSCMCRVTKGTVIMKTNHILTDEEIEEGLILSCQSYVTSDEISIDYDDV